MLLGHQMAVLHGSSKLTHKLGDLLDTQRGYKVGQLIMIWPSQSYYWLFEYKL